MEAGLTGSAMGMVFSAGNDVFGDVMRAGCARDVLQLGVGLSFVGLTGSRNASLTSGVLFVVVVDKGVSRRLDGVSDVIVVATTGSRRARAVGVSAAGVTDGVLRGVACGVVRAASLRTSVVLLLAVLSAGTCLEADTSSAVLVFVTDVALTADVISLVKSRRGVVTGCCDVAVASVTVVWLLRELAPASRRGLAPTSRRGLAPASRRGLAPASRRGLAPTSRRGLACRKLSSSSSWAARRARSSASRDDVVRSVGCGVVSASLRVVWLLREPAPESRRGLAPESRRGLACRKFSSSSWAARRARSSARRDDARSDSLTFVGLLSNSNSA